MHAEISHSIHVYEDLFSFFFVSVYTREIVAFALLELNGINFNAPRYSISITILYSLVWEYESSQVRIKLNEPCSFIQINA